MPKRGSWTEWSISCLFNWCAFAKMNPSNERSCKLTSVLLPDPTVLKWKDIPQLPCETQDSCKSLLLPLIKGKKCFSCWIVTRLSNRANSIFLSQSLSVFYTLFSVTCSINSSLFTVVFTEGDDDTVACFFITTYLIFPRKTVMTAYDLKTRILCSKAYNWLK